MELNMESAYTLANRELTEIREQNRAEQRRRTDEIIGLAPEYLEIERELARGGTALLRCVLNKTADISKIRAHIEKMQKKKADLLQRLGKPADYLDDLFHCELCRDTGFDEEGHRCSCLKNLILKYVSANANLTPYMKEQTFENFDYFLFSSQPNDRGRNPLKYMQAAHNRALRFAETFDETHENLLLIGNAGTGKTFLSSCIANYALKRQKTVYYQTAFKLFECFENVKFGKLNAEDAEQADTIIRYVYDTDLLIIDDLGTEFVTQYTAATLFDIVNTRMLQNKSTIISTNLSLQGLEDTYSARFTSRITGAYQVLSFIGKDLRRIKFSN